ncbi:MAG: hypothetical protein ABIS03_09785, partial [Gemmatimonadaceae bacterium]
MSASSVGNRGRWTIVAGFFGLALVLRCATAYHGGLSADEAVLLLVAKSASWRDMLDFLRFH